MNMRSSGITFAKLQTSYHGAIWFNKICRICSWFMSLAHVHITHSCQKVLQ